MAVAARGFTAFSAVQSSGAPNAIASRSLDGQCARSRQAKVQGVCDCARGCRRRCTAAWVARKPFQLGGVQGVSLLLQQGVRSHRRERKPNIRQQVICADVVMRRRLAAEIDLNLVCNERGDEAGVCIVLSGLGMQDKIAGRGAALYDQATCTSASGILAISPSD